MSLRSRSTITIVVVMLSSTAEKMNVTAQITQSSVRLWRVVMRLVMTVKPPWMSTSLHDCHGTDQKEECLGHVAQ